MFKKMFNKKEANKVNKIKKEGYVIWKYTKDLRWENEEIVAICADEDEALQEIERLKEIEYDLGDATATFDYEYEIWYEEN